LKSLFFMPLSRLFFSFLLFSSLTLRAEFSISENCSIAADLIFQARCSDAERFLELEEKLNPDNNLVYLLRYYALSVDFLRTENPAFLSKLNKEKKLWEQKIASDPDNTSPWKFYSLGQMNLISALLRGRSGDWISCAKDLKDAYMLLRNCRKNFPDFYPCKISFGFLVAVSGSAPPNYQWVLGLAGVKGNVQEGLALLDEGLSEALAGKNAWSIKEGIILKSFAHRNFIEDKSQTILFLNLIPESQYAQYPLVKYGLVSLALKVGNNEWAITCLVSGEKETHLANFPFLNYQLGICYLNKCSQEAKFWFEKFLEKFKGVSMVKSAYHKLAWASILEGKTEKYASFMEKSGKNGASVLEDDKQAENEFKSGQIPNPVLLKSRLFFDGGYLKASLDELLRARKSGKLKTMEEQFEATYRMARIYQVKLEFEKAVPLFEAVVNAKFLQKTYMPANAALMLGNIYEIRGNFQAARGFYQKVLNLNGFEYENSLKQKAKAGLSRIKS
jgi:tetratricopeptide (TPR) repeat protein